jgi:MaoC like domain
VAGIDQGFDPARHAVSPQRWFEDLAVGERYLLPSRTVTDASFAAFQTVSGDNHPIHYDVEFCRLRGLPGPLAHGLQVLCFTAAGAGRFPHEVSTRSLGSSSNRRNFSCRYWPAIRFIRCSRSSS